MIRVTERTLADNETVIADGLRTFVDVGQALARIRDAEQYRTTHSTFEAYCLERWDFTRMRAHQLMSAAAVTENVNHGLRSNVPPPTNERQTRELAKLDPKEQPKAWAEAVKTAPDGVVTAKHVAAVAFAAGES